MRFTIFITFLLFSYSWGAKSHASQSYLQSHCDTCQEENLKRTIFKQVSFILIQFESKTLSLKQFSYLLKLHVFQTKYIFTIIIFKNMELYLHNKCF